MWGVCAVLCCAVLVWNIYPKRRSETSSASHIMRGTLLSFPLCTALSLYVSRCGVKLCARCFSWRCSTVLKDSAMRSTIQRLLPTTLHWHRSATAAAATRIVRRVSIACFPGSNACTLQIAASTTASATALPVLAVTTADSLVSLTLFIYFSYHMSRDILRQWSITVCGGLADGRNRTPRENNHCECPEGWEGINCNGRNLVAIRLCTDMH